VLISFLVALTGLLITSYLVFDTLAINSSQLDVTSNLIPGLLRTLAAALLAPIIAYHDLPGTYAINEAPSDAPS
jgi:hypothetical protein